MFETPASASLTLELTRGGPAAVLTVTGHLAESAHHELRTLVNSLIAAGVRDVVVHLDTRGTPDAAFLQTLRRAHARLAGLGGQLRATTTAPATRTLLAMTGLTQHTVPVIAPGSTFETTHYLAVEQRDTRGFGRPVAAPTALLGD